MTTLLVTGASGLLGGHLLANPGMARYRVRAITRRARTRADSANGVAWLQADLATGAGLDDATRGVDVIIHAASSPKRDTRRTDVEGTERLLAAAKGAGVGHVIYVSIVGVDRIPVAYYRHKLAAEHVVASSGVPWTVVRGTQFHDFMDGFCRQLTRLPFALVPAGFPSQSIHVAEFADLLWRVAAVSPARNVHEAGGPEVMSWKEMVSQWMHAHGMRKPVLSLPIPGGAAAALRRGDGTCPAHSVGTVTWRDWLRQTVGGGTRATS